MGKIQMIKKIFKSFSFINHCNIMRKFNSLTNQNKINIVLKNNELLCSKFPLISCNMLCMIINLNQ